MAEINACDSCSLEDQEEMKIIYKNKGVNGCLEHFKKKNSEWKTKPLNIGIIGASGAGKSSFINVFRGLTKADQKGWAPVGVTETTLIPTEYPHQTNKMLILWDLPGVGTDNFPKESYLEEIKGDKYDYFVLITAKRFIQLDAFLAEEINKRRKHFYFVRTMIEIDVANERADSGQTEETTVEKIRGSTLENLKKLKFNDVPVFLIDNKKPLKYDFDALLKTIIEDLPDLKHQAMILSMTVYTESLIEMKVEELHKLAWFAAFASAVVGAIPIPGVSLFFDCALVLRALWSYFHQLGLDEDSLKQRAEILGVEYESLQAIVRREFPVRFGLEMLKTLAQVGGFVVGMAVEDGLKCIPIIGSVVGFTTSFAYTKYVLYSQLNKMKETSLELTKLYPKSKLFTYEEENINI